MTTNYVQLFVSILLARISSALICYDSAGASPKATSECRIDMICYSEYYSVNRSGVVRQYFDRFCAHRKHCLYRGIDQSCQTLEQLDKGIQKTFFNYHHAKPSRKTLMHSRFCCCETDRCNDFDSKMAYEIFGTISTSNQMPSPIINVIIVFLLYFMMIMSQKI